MRVPGSQSTCYVWSSILHLKEKKEGLWMTDNDRLADAWNSAYSNHSKSFPEFTDLVLKSSISIHHYRWGFDIFSWGGVCTECSPSIVESTAPSSSHTCLGKVFFTQSVGNPLPQVRNQITPIFVHFKLMLYDLLLLIQCLVQAKWTYKLPTSVTPHSQTI